MEAVSVRELKTNPSVALRQAAEDIVVVTNRDEPQAVLLDLKLLGLPDMEGVKRALAQSLFKQGTVSLGYSARMAGMSKSEWTQFLSKRGVPIISLSTSELDEELQTATNFALKTA